LALLRDGGELGRTLAAAGVTLPVARAQVEALGGVGETQRLGHVGFTPRAKRVLELSRRVAQRLGQDHIGRSAILRGLLEIRAAGSPADCAPTADTWTDAPPIAAVAAA